MKVSMKLTMDGLVRALRWRAHLLAEQGTQQARRAPAARTDMKHVEEMEADHDQRGR